MAQDVIAHGVTYNNISEVNMPLTDGGTARFFDISDTTAEASDVVEGRVIYDANGVRTIGTADPHFGLPSGGLTNEVLTKISDEDYDIGWVSAPVTSVNGKSGDVVLDASDVGAAPSDVYASTSEYGIVKLSDSVLLSSTSLAATASAVAVAYARAVAAYGEAYDVRIVANNAKSLASDAYSLASSAYSLATSAKSQASSASAKANGAQSRANSAFSAAEVAKTSASAALELANDAISQSSSALSLASDAIAESSSAYTLASGAVTEASSAYTLASDAYALAGTKVTAEEAAAAAPVQSVNNQTGNITLTAADIGALPSDTALPSKVSDLDNDLGFISTEVDPTVPAWAKAVNKPTYTASEVGALPNTTAIPSKVSDLDNDLGFIVTEVDPTVPAWAKASTKPSYTASEVSAIAIPTVASSGQLLGYDGSEWTAMTIDFNSLPSGGSTGQVLAKSSDDDYSVAWTTVQNGSSLPSGGTIGQMLIKASSSDYDVTWADPSGGGGQILPPGGDAGQILVKATASDYDVSWGSIPVQSVNGKTGVISLNASDVGALPYDTAIPSCAADVGALPSDTFIPSSAADIGALSSDTFIPTTASDVGAIPAPASASSDNVLAYNGSAWVPDKRTVILSYGKSTWAQFISAYKSNAVMYCRASSNSNPATGVQGRLAFMAYVDNGDNPTSVEFQYYRSVNSHSYAQQGDQVFIYKLTSSGTWTVTTREAYTKIVPGTGLSSSYSNGVLTLTNAAAVPTGGTTGQALVKTSSSNYALAWQTIDAGHSIPSGGLNGQVLAKSSDDDYAVTWTSVSQVPAITSADNGKFLRVVDGAWAAQSVDYANGVIF